VSEQTQTRAYHCHSSMVIQTISRAGGCASKPMLPLRPLHKQFNALKRLIYLPDDEATDVGSDKAEKLAIARNMMAIACLTASFQDD
jgi:hypothetical protein